MGIITVLPENTDQETAIKLFLDALHVQYKTTGKEIDDTEYLSASAAMKEHLDKAAQQEKNGEGVNISLDDIWK